MKRLLGYVTLRTAESGTVLFRPQRGGLEESMHECVELPATLDALAQHLSKLNLYGRTDYTATEIGMRKVYAGTIRVEPYCFDLRTQWDTHIVTINGNATGFTDGPVGEE